ncbi:hypothetical protein ES705_39716 [subsurface metagenome]
MLPDRLNLCRTKGRFEVSETGYKIPLKAEILTLFFFDLKVIVYNEGNLKK